MNFDKAQAFHAKMVEACNTSAELGYTPLRMQGMLNVSNAVTVAKRMIASGDIQQGLREMCEMQRPDLTLEHTMLQPEFSGLFSKAELDAASWRLQQAQA